MKSKDKSGAPNVEGTPLTLRPVAGLDLQDRRLQAQSGRRLVLKSDFPMLLNIKDSGGKGRNFDIHMKILQDLIF